MIKNKYMFYLLSFTWGLPMTLIGVITAVILRAKGYRPKKWGYCYHFEVGESWGGINLGPIFVTSKNAPERTKNHEHGHAIQNCNFGLLMPFIVGIPSLLRSRYHVWYYRNRYPKTKRPLPNYYSVWFENQASTLGDEFIRWYNTKQND